MFRREFRTVFPWPVACVAYGQLYPTPSPQQQEEVVKLNALGNASRNIVVKMMKQPRAGMHRSPASRTGAALHLALGRQIAPVHELAMEVYALWPRNRPCHTRSRRRE